MPQQPKDVLESHLVQLAHEYRELVHLTEQTARDVEEQRALLSERSVVHDQIIVLFEELHMPFLDRDDVRRQVLAIAVRGHI